MPDDEPSDDDLDRFSDESGWCPDCGAEVWDEAWQCPHCGEVIEGRVSRTREEPAGREIGKRTVIALVILIVLILVVAQTT